MSTYGRMVDDRLDQPPAPRGEGGYYHRKGSTTITVDGDLSKHADRKGQPVYTGVLKYFPNALKEVSKCSLAGQKQHNQGDELYWDKNKSFDNEDALVRHLIDHGIDPMDDDGVLHLAKVAWRALASLEIYLENK
jgi:hypothetical protein